MIRCSPYLAHSKKIRHSLLFAIIFLLLSLRPAHGNPYLAKPGERHISARFGTFRQLVEKCENPCFSEELTAPRPRARAPRFPGRGRPVRAPAPNRAGSRRPSRSSMANSIPITSLDRVHCLS